MSVHTHRNTKCQYVQDNQLCHVVHKNDNSTCMTIIIILGCGARTINYLTQCLLMREVHLMSEPRIVNIIEFLDRSSRVINLKIRLPMTALQFGIRHSTNKPDALQNRGRLSKRLRILLYATFKR